MGAAALAACAAHSRRGRAGRRRARDRGRGHLHVAPQLPHLPHRRLSRHGALVRRERAARACGAEAPAAAAAAVTPTAARTSGELKARVPGLFVQVRRANGTIVATGAAPQFPGTKKQPPPRLPKTIVLTSRQGVDRVGYFTVDATTGGEPLPRARVDRPGQQRVHADRRHLAEQRRQHPAPAAPRRAARDAWPCSAVSRCSGSG